MCLIEIWFGDRRNLYNRMKYRLVYNCPTEWPIISFILDLKKNQTAEFLIPIVLIRWKCWHCVNSHFASFVEKKRWKNPNSMNFVGEISRCNRRSFRKNVYIFHLFEFFSIEKPTQPSILEYSGFQVVVNRLKRLRMLLSHHFCCCRCFDSICRDYNYQFEWAIDAINLIIRGFFLLKHS